MQANISFSSSCLDPSESDTIITDSKNGALLYGTETRNCITQISKFIPETPTGYFEVLALINLGTYTANLVYRGQNLGVATETFLKRRNSWSDRYAKNYGVLYIYCMPITFCLLSERMFVGIDGEQYTWI